MRNVLLASIISVTPFLTSLTATAATLPVDGSWVQADDYHATGSFFSDSWDFTCSKACRLDVSDWAVISDLFEVFNNAVSIGLTSVVPSWNSIGCTGAFDPACYTSDPDTAWADARYSKASFALGAGNHSITVKSLFIPLQTDPGDPFGDSTVQLRVSPVPVPASLGLLSAGLAAIGVFKKRRKIG